MANDTFFSTGGSIAVYAARALMRPNIDPDAVLMEPMQDRSDWLLAGCGIDAPQFIPSGYMRGAQDIRGNVVAYEPCVER